MAFVIAEPCIGVKDTACVECIAYDATVIALQHVRVIDGTGAPAQEDQTLVIDHGRIAAIGPADSVKAARGRAGRGSEGLHRHSRP